MHQVLLNLLKNAAEAGSAPEGITLRGASPGWDEFRSPTAAPG